MTSTDSAHAERIRIVLFALTGAFLPFFAFAPFRFHGKMADVSTLLAALFVLASIPRFVRDASARLRLWAVAAVLVPLLVLVPPRPSPFESGQYVMSYLHWLLGAGFFCASAMLRLDEGARRVVIAVQVAVAALMAAFALCQVVGDPAVWSLADTVLHPLQRDPFRAPNIGSYFRPTAFFQEPAWLGIHLAWTMVLAAWMATAGAVRDLPARVAAGVAFVLCALALVATVSWGAYLNGVVCLGAFAGLMLKESRFRRRHVAAAALVVLVLAVSLLLSPPGAAVRSAIRTRVGYLRRTPLTGRLGPLDSADSSRKRVDDAIADLHHFSAHPVGGIGLGQGECHGRVERDGDVTMAKYHPATGWLAVAGEMGAAGPLLLAGALAFGFQRVRSWRGPAGDRALAISLLLVTAVQALHTGAYLDLSWWFPVSLAFVVMTGAPLPPSADRHVAHPARE